MWSSDERFDRSDWSWDQDARDEVCSNGVVYGRPVAGIGSIIGALMGESGSLLQNTMPLAFAPAQP